MGEANGKSSTFTINNNNRLYKQIVWEPCGYFITLFTRALTICMENPENPGRIQMERFNPVGIFRKKRYYLFSRFDRNNRNFLYHLSGLLVPGFMSRESENFIAIL